MSSPLVRLIRAADTRRVPWRNGRGVTEEILVRPGGSSFERGDFDLRISKAVVDAPGPFSQFAGFDRVLVVTSGAGLVLSHGDAAPSAHVLPLVPYAFSGDWTTRAELVAGAVSDFNVLALRGRVRATVEVLRVGDGAVEASLGAGDAVVHLLSGVASIRVAAAHERLGPGDSFCAFDSAPVSVILTPTGRTADCVALLVRATAE